MKGYLSYALVGIVLGVCSCGGGDSSTQDNGWQEGEIVITMEGETYTDEVRVYYSESSGLTVFSDKDDVTDTDGDGLIIALFQTGKRIQFDFVRNGKRFGGKVREWERENNLISGSALMLEEDQFSGGSEMSFVITTH